MKINDIFSNLFFKEIVILKKSLKLTKSFTSKINYSVVKVIYSCEIKNIIANKFFLPFYCRRWSGARRFQKLKSHSDTCQFLC